MTEEIFVSDGRLEAKVVSTTQNDKGWYVRLFLHPNDAAEVTKLRYGAVLDIRWREVLNVDVEPIEVESPKAAGGHARAAALSPEERSAIATKGADARWKPKQRFAELPLSQQAGIRCEDEQFWKFLLAEKGYIVNDAVNAGDAVRHICGVKSRSELATNEDAAKKWTALNWEFEGWLITRKYADTRR